MLRSLLLALALLLAAMGTPATEAGDVHVRHAWIRLLPGDLPAGAYAELQNSGADPITLQSVSSPDYADAMLHQSRHDGGMSRMVMVDRIVIPARGTVRFSPGGYHVMLMSPRRALKVGDAVVLRFAFADGSQAEAAFAVREAGYVDPAG